MFRMICAALIVTAGVLIADTSRASGLDSGIEAFHREDYLGALQDLYAPAEAGNAVAQYFVGVILWNGFLFPPDQEEAFRWFMRSARQGDRDSEYGVGSTLVFGEGVAQDVEAGVKWLERAADHESLAAQSLLAVLYYNDEYFPAENIQAYHWAGRAAERNDATGLFVLAELYRYGRFVKKDSVKAMSLYRRSRDAGDEDADGTLAVMYMEGEAGAWMVPWGYALIYYEAYRQALADAFPWGEVFREMVLNVFRVVQAVLSPFSFE